MIKCSSCKCWREPAVVEGRALKRCEECRDKHVVYLRARYHANPAAHHEREREYRKKSPRRALYTALWNAAARTDDVTVTLDELMATFRQQGGKCALSGVEMTWARGKTLPTSVSIDRIDQSRGYHADNVRLVCMAVNAFRGIMTDEEMVAMAQAIVTHAALRGRAAA